MNHRGHRGRQVGSKQKAERRTQKINLKFAVCNFHFSIWFSFLSVLCGSIRSQQEHSQQKEKAGANARLSHGSFLNLISLPLPSRRQAWECFRLSSVRQASKRRSHFPFARLSEPPYQQPLPSCSYLRRSRLVQSSAMASECCHSVSLRDRVQFYPKQ